MFKLLLISTVFAVLSCSTGDVCKSPTVQARTYTTTDGMVISEVALITEFSVECENSAKVFSVYADVKGKTFPAVKSSDRKKFQVSWTVDSSKISSGTQDVKFYDEELFAALRKAQRSGEKSEVPSAFSIDVFHSGTYYGPLVQSEFLAACCSFILFYIAYNEKSKLVS